MSRLIEIRTLLSPEDAASHLAAVVRPPAWRDWGRTGLVGHVSAERVAVHLHQAYIRNPFSRLLVARWEVEDGHTLLRGKFRLHRMAATFLWIWLLGLGTITALFVLGAILGQFPWESLASPLIMLAATVAVVSLSQSSAESKYIEERLQSALEEAAT